MEPQRIVRHPDSHQLSIGNLPHEVDKSELKDFFQNYGNVVELRINSGGKLSNFGFVVFDDSEPGGFLRLDPAFAYAEPPSS